MFMTPRQIAMKLQVSLSDLNAMTERGDISHVEVNGEVRFVWPEVVIAILRSTQPNMKENTDGHIDLTHD